jgi:hypothetical protein
MLIFANQAGQLGRWRHERGLQRRRNGGRPGDLQHGRLQCSRDCRCERQWLPTVGTQRSHQVRAVKAIDAIVA